MKKKIYSDKADLKNIQIPVSFTRAMKTDIERESKGLGISEQGFIRLCVSLYFRGTKLKPSDLVKEV